MSTLPLPFVLIGKCSLFSALLSIPHVFAHDEAAAKSNESAEQVEVTVSPIVYAVVSSAKMEHPFWRDKGRSLIKTRNKTRPRTVP